ncbi:hypothetical protein [Eubacterium aggregans]|uniref:hypothetical protein n=1 Tax=Eubacterium aggregans TaxID=81409 RepID=UPI0015A1F1E2|nr:hypothetical protein [Eubacterium aggregans]
MAPGILWASDIQTYFKNQIVARVREYDKPQWVLEMSATAIRGAGLRGRRSEDVG